MLFMTLLNNFNKKHSVQFLLGTMGHISDKESWLSSRKNVHFTEVWQVNTILKVRMEEVIH